MTTDNTTAPPRLAPAQLDPEGRFLGSLYARNIRSVFARGLKATWGSNWSIMISGFVEPVLYLVAMGIGLGSLIGTVRQLHCPGTACRFSNERSGVRLHHERLLQAQLRQAL
jgi:hypothetical protein